MTIYLSIILLSILAYFAKSETIQVRNEGASNEWWYAAKVLLGDQVILVDKFEIESNGQFTTCSNAANIWQNYGCSASITLPLGIRLTKNNIAITVHNLVTTYNDQDVFDTQQNFESPPATTSAPVTTSAPATTATPVTTQAAITTSTPATTSAPATTTSAPVTTATPVTTQAATTTSAPATTTATTTPATTTTTPATTTPATTATTTATPATTTPATTTTPTTTSTPATTATPATTTTATPAATTTNSPAATGTWPTWIDPVDRSSINNRREDYRISTLSGCGTGRRVSLTFDDGPAEKEADGGSLVPTSLIMDTLDEYNIIGTFFVSPAAWGDGDDVLAQRCALIGEIVDRGHEIQSHSWSHPNFHEHHLTDAEVIEELRHTSDFIFDCSNGRVRPTIFRPPFGGLGLSAHQAEMIVDLGYVISLWNLDSKDFWHYNDVDWIIGNIDLDKYDEDVTSINLLMHDRSVHLILDQIIQHFGVQGYQFISQTECWEKCDTVDSAGVCMDNTAADVDPCWLPHNQADCTSCLWENLEEDGYYGWRNNALGECDWTWTCKNAPPPINPPPGGGGGGSDTGNLIIKTNGSPNTWWLSATISGSQSDHVSIFAIKKDDGTSWNNCVRTDGTRDWSCSPAAELSYPLDVRVVIGNSEYIIHGLIENMDPDREWDTGMVPAAPANAEIVSKQESSNKHQTDGALSYNVGYVLNMIIAVIFIYFYG